MKDAHVFSHYKEAVIGAVVDLAAEHPEIVFLDADLSSCIGSTTFQKAYTVLCPGTREVEPSEFSVVVAVTISMLLPSMEEGDGLF